MVVKRQFPTFTISLVGAGQLLLKLIFRYFLALFEDALEANSCTRPRPSGETGWYEPAMGRVRIQCEFTNSSNGKLYGQWFWGDEPTRSRP